MAKPERFSEPDLGERTYFVTAITWGRRPLFRSERLARLFLEVLQHYRAEHRYSLHDFTLMPDHFHLILTPTGITLERAIQFIKGGYSRRASVELRFTGEIWQRGFADHRLRDAEDYLVHCNYILWNAVKRRLATSPEEYPYCSAFPGIEIDPLPPYLRG